MTTRPSMDDMTLRELVVFNIERVEALITLATTKQPDPAPEHSDLWIVGYNSFANIVPYEGVACANPFALSDPICGFEAARADYHRDGRVKKQREIDSIG